MAANRVICAVLGLLALGTVALLPAGAAPKESKRSAGMPFTVLREGQFSQVDFPLEAAVRDQDAWEALWSMHADSPTCGFTTPPPDVDFDNDMVVAVFLGMRPNTAYSVRLDKVTRTEDGGYLVEYVEEEIRAKGVVFDDIVTTPFVIGVLPRTEGEITFQGTKVIVKRRK